MSDALSRWIADEQVPQVALHEAGHAVVSILTPAGLRDVFLRPAEDSGGLWVGQANKLDVFATDARQDAMIAAGGLVAESIRRAESSEACLSWIREKLDPEGEEDISGLCDEASLLCAEEEGVDIETAIRDTHALLSARWFAVEAVAAALVSRWTPDGPLSLLTGDEVRAIVETVP